MENWQDDFRQLVSKLEHAVDKGRFTLKQKLNLLDDITIQPYRSLGNQNGLHIQGRVLEKEGLELPPEEASLWENISILYHRYESDEIPHAPLRCSFQDQEQKLEADDEGYFRGNFPIQASYAGWHTVKYELLKQYKEDQEKVVVTGDVLFPAPENSFGIISDLDDTVIVSQATDFFEKSRILLLNNERTRKPFEGVAAFYQALQGGHDGHRNNPFFYVSSSSWNLYDMFKNFCEINELPKGVFLLREVGLDKKKFYKSGHLEHKLEKITHALDTFSQLSFILIGDSGQKDPEIYQEVVKQYPGRILGIYIRDVNPAKDEKRDQEVHQIAEAIRQQGVPMRLVKNSTEAAEHAAEMGWIPKESLVAVRQDTENDMREEPNVRHMLGLDKLLGHK